jgi:hypothetical protein
MRRAHVLGLLLWRGGTMLVLGTVLFEGGRWLLRFFKVPVELEVGFGMLIAGLALVVLSLVLERWRDYRGEGEMGE